MHMVLCHGPIDALTRIRIDDRDAWNGEDIDTTLTIDKPELFGGESREGGVTGSLDVLSGSSSQTKNTYLQSKLGTNIPAFRGVTSIVLKQMYLGMNPYLKRWAFRASRIHKSTDGATQWYDAKSEISVNGLDYTASGWDYQIIAHHSNPATNLDIPSSGWTSGVSSPFGGGTTDPSAPAPIQTNWPIKTILWARKTVSSAGYKRTLTFFVYAENGAVIFLNGNVVKIINISNTEPNPESGIQSFSATVEAGQEVEIAVKAYDETVAAGGTYFGIKYTTQADMNPAHIIRECLTDSNWGMGYLSADIDDTSFTSAADTLYDEEMGMSLLWDRQIPLEEFISEVIRHINAVLYIDRTSGKFVLKLIRADYDEGTLLTLDESNINSISDYSRTDLADTVNSVTVVYWDHQKGKNAGVTADDVALIQSQGTVINTTIQYPGFTNTQIAGIAATRDLRTLSTPLLSVKIDANREAASLNIGDVFKFTWSENHDGYIVMRVMQIALGDGKSNKVKIVASEDIYALPSTSWLAEEEGGWEDPVGDAVAVEDQISFEIPYLELVQIQSQTTVDELITSNPALGYFGMAAKRPGTNSINARLYTDAGGGYEEAGLLDFCPSAELDQNIGKTDTSFDIINEEDLENIDTGTWFQIGSEIMKYVSFAAGVITVERGLLDTVPTEHTSGEILYFWDIYSASDPTEYADGETINGKLTTVSTGGELNIADASVSPVTMDARAYRPYPPGKFQINASYFPETMSGSSGLALTWAHRDRLQQTGGDYYSFTDDSIGPEASTTYNIRIYDENDSLLHTESALTGTSFNYTTSDELTDEGGGNYEVSINNLAALAGYWRFGESSGSTATDETSTNDGTYQNSPTLSSTGLINDTNTCVTLNGSNQYIEMGNTLNFGTSDWSFGAWFRVNGGTYNTLIDKRNGTPGYIFGVRNTGVINFYIGDSGGNAEYSGSVVNDGSVHFCVVTVDRTNDIARIYVDGVEDGTLDISGVTGSISNSGNLRFGWKSPAASAWTYFNGALDEYFFTTSVISASEISDLYDLGVSGATARLNGKLRIELESARDGYTSYTKHDHTVKRLGYGFNYGEYYGGS